MSFPLSLKRSLDKRKEEKMLRSLLSTEGLIDFCSNDYLGFARSAALKDLTAQLSPNYGNNNGSTGSRLISGNHKAIETLEGKIADFHRAESALLFNSGYDANLGLLSCIGKKDDVIIYDELVHASLHDGMRISHSSYYKFKHNDVEDLKRLLNKYNNASTVYVVVESVYSMDGDCSPLKEIAALKSEFNFYLIVDEAHATGVFGPSGKGLICEFGIEHLTFARIITYGKAMGVHGAAIVGSNDLRTYLINFARAFIYTTALSPHAYAAIDAAYTLLQKTNEVNKVKRNIELYRSIWLKNGLVSNSISPIQIIVIPDNQKVSELAENIRNNGWDVRAIKSPTVKAGTERLRICLHSFNSEADIIGLCSFIQSSFGS